MRSNQRTHIVSLDPPVRSTGLRERLEDRIVSDLSNVTHAWVNLAGDAVTLWVVEPPEATD